MTNYPPVAGVTNHSMTMIAGETVTIDLYPAYGISDPEGDFLTSAVDSYEPMPAGITVTSADPLLVTVQADPSLATGVLSNPVSLIVSDSYGGSVEMTLTIEIVLPPNDPPIAITSTYTVVIAQGETIVLPMDQTHGISDPNGDVLTIDVSAWPASISQKPDVGSPLGELQMSITAHPGAAIGLSTDPITTRITDSRGAFIDVDTFLEVVAAVINTPPNVVTADIPVSMQAGASGTLSVDTSHGATDPDGDVIWVELDPAGVVPAGLTVTDDRSRCHDRRRPVDVIRCCGLGVAAGD